MASIPHVVLNMGFVRAPDKLAKNPKLKKLYEGRRKYYSCDNGGMDYLTYIDLGTQEQNEFLKSDYLGYSGDKEKSSGVFGPKGLLTKHERAELRSALRNTESTIWIGIVSFEEAFGKRYCNTYEDAYRLMGIEFPRFLKNAGFDPEKITWYAALHENTDNRHIHFSFFEQEPCTYRANAKGFVFSNGKIDLKCFEKFKVACEQRLTDITSEIKASRNEITDLSRDILFSKGSKAKYQSSLQSQLKILVENFPREGRLSYDSENMSGLKPYINGIIDAVIKFDGNLYRRFSGFCRAVRKKDMETLQMLKDNKINENEWGGYLIGDKYIRDLYRRLGNQVINAARVIKGKEKLTKKNRLANKNIRRRTIASLVEYALRLNSSVEAEAYEAFEEYFRKLEAEKETKSKGGEESELE